MKPDSAKRIIKFSLIIAGLSGLIGLHYNIRTEPLNQKLQILRQEVALLEESVKEHRIDYLRLTQLSELEKRAINELGMIYPKHVHLWIVSANHEVSE